MCGEGARRQGHHRVAASAAVPASHAHALLGGAGAAVGAGAPHSETAAPARIALPPLALERHRVASGAVVGPAARRLDGDAQIDGGVGGEGDLRETTGDAVECGVVRLVLRLVGDDEVEAERAEGRHRLAHVDETHLARRVDVGSGAAEVGIGKLGLEEVEVERLADARGEGRRRRERR